MRQHRGSDGGLGEIGGHEQAPESAARMVPAQSRMQNF
jgi:hypothetical protein